MEGVFTISSIIIIVWLIFPGVVFKRFYYKGQFAKQFGIGLFADRLITSIFWGIIVQIITFLFYSRYLGFTFTGIKKKIGEVYASVAANKMPNITYENLIYILGYLAFLIIIAFFLGTLIHHLIRYFKIDVKVPVFRFANHWNYYFRGEIASMREFKSLKKGKWLSTMVDIVINDGTEKTKMVSGFLTQHTISEKTGDLETIYLTGATRYSQTEKKFKPIPGDCLVVPFQNIIDLNLRYTFQVLNPTQNKQLIFNKIIRLILTMGFFLIMVYSWILKVSFLFTLLSIIFGFISWLSLVILITNPFQPNKKIKLRKNDLWIIFLIMATSLMASMLLLGIAPSFSLTQIKKFFTN